MIFYEELENAVCELVEEYAGFTAEQVRESIYENEHFVDTMGELNERVWIGLCGYGLTEEEHEEHTKNEFTDQREQVIGELIRRIEGIA